MIKLYKLDFKGKTRVIEYSTNGSQLIQKSGILNGKFTETIKVCKGKNINKSNETTPEDQAILEMNSKVSKKLDQGYVLELESAERPLSPMLAKEYLKEKHKVLNKEVAIQNKLDGQRAFYSNKNKFISRKGKEIDTVSYIVKALEKLNLPNDIIFDGELYKEDVGFQYIMKHLKKERENSSIKYFIYDIVDETKTYKERREYLESLNLTTEYSELLPEIQIILTEEAIITAYEKAIQDNYEGLMIRDLEGLYEINKRSSSLLKYKQFQDIQLKVVDVIPGDSYVDQGVLVCQINDTTVKASYKGDWKARQELLTNKDSYIGQTAEIRFFEFTDEGLPRFPICCGFLYDSITN